MRKKSIVNAIIALVLVGIAVLILFLTPVSGADLSLIKTTDVPNALIAMFKNLPTSFNNLFAVIGLSNIEVIPSNVMLSWLAFIGLIIAVVVWVVQLIGIFVKKRGSGFVCAFLYLITVSIAWSILWSAICGSAVVPNSTIVHVLWAGTKPVEGGFLPNVGHYAQFIYTSLPYLLALIAIIISIIYDLISFADALKNGKQKVKKAKPVKTTKNAKLGAVKYDEEKAPEEPVIDEASLRAAQYEELAKAGQIELGGNRAPAIVQNFYGGGPAQQQAPAPAPYVPYPYPFPPFYPYPPFQHEEVKKEETKEEMAPAPVEEDNRPLTAKELREIIAEALDDHDHPENDRPLTDDEARDLIRQELDAYYAGARPVNDGDETGNATLTGEDVRTIIREEIAVMSSKEEEDEIVETEDSFVEEETTPLIETTPVQNPSISLDDIRSVINDAFAAQNEKEAKKEAVQKSVEERQNAAINLIAQSVLTADEVRSIVADEMEKRLSTFVVATPQAKEEPEVIADVSNTVETVIVPEPMVELETIEAPVEQAPVIYERKTFADRFAQCDQSLLDNYNELKAYLLAYGLKSRLSNSGDTFRLSCVTYCKITVAGKGLKLYLPLDPKNFIESTIPVIDVSAKNIYKDIPVCFKVKSGLSMKRAKQLIDMACALSIGGNPPLVQGPIVNGNYAEELKDYKPQGGDEDELEEE